MLTFLFILNVAISIFAVYSLLRDSAQARRSGLGAATGIFWWTLLSCIWLLFALNFHYTK